MKRNIFRGHLCGTIVLIMCFLGTPAVAATWYVDVNASSGGDGTSWATAFRDLQTAINAASPLWVVCMAPSDVIKVKEGTYNISSTITVNKIVTIQGGYDSVTGERDWLANPTIIDANDLRRCMIISKLCQVSGFIFREGNAGLGRAGGGIYIDNALTYGSLCDRYFSPRISSCIFFNNDGGTAGGGIYSTGSDPDIIGCTFADNEARSGGAIYSHLSSLTVEKCIFRDNQSTAVGSLGGGAIGAFDNNPTTEENTYYYNCLFYNNTSNSWGGAISTNQIFPRIRYCTFVDNDADDTGGAYFCDPYTDAPFVYNSIFWGNTPDHLDVVTANPYWYVRHSDVQGGWTGPGYNNIDENPDFVGVSDFHLTADSPCIDVGANLADPDDDLEWTIRPLDGDGDGDARADMGCYEYAAITFDPPEIDNISFQGCLSELCTTPISVTAHDPEGGSLSYTWIKNGGNIIGSGSSVQFDPPDSGPHPCPYIITVTATSSVSGLSANQTLYIYVKLAGDVNSDGVVNVLDKVAVRNAFGTTGPGQSDVNCDNVVNILDKVIVRNQFGQGGCACP